jgi:hypothetical protein
MTPLPLKPPTLYQLGESRKLPINRFSKGRPLAAIKAEGGAALSPKARNSHPLHSVERRGRRATLAVIWPPNCWISTSVAMLIRSEWPMHSTEQPTDPEGDHGGGIGLRLNSAT